MNRLITNSIKFLMDECLPPIIRDSKIFMYPFFYIWFKGKNIKENMNFKSNVYNFSEKEREEFYRNLTSISTSRKTDLSEISIRYIIENLHKEAKTLLDIGCGNGYFLKKVISKIDLECHGCDIHENLVIEGVTYHKGDIEKLPFSDAAFDIVTCHHTIEHVVNLEQAINELKRVARKQLMIIVPCQKYYYYTLDAHIHFFPYKAKLEHTIGIPENVCKKIWGDWVYWGYFNK